MSPSESHPELRAPNAANGPIVAPRSPAVLIKPKARLRKFFGTWSPAMAGIKVSVLLPANGTRNAPIKARLRISPLISHKPSPPKTIATPNYRPSPAKPIGNRTSQRRAADTGQIAQGSIQPCKGSYGNEQRAICAPSPNISESHRIAVAAKTPQAKKRAIKTVNEVAADYLPGQSLRC